MKEKAKLFMFIGIGMVAIALAIQLADHPVHAGESASSFAGIQVFRLPPKYGMPRTILYAITESGEVWQKIESPESVEKMEWTLVDRVGSTGANATGK